MLLDTLLLIKVCLKAETNKTKLSKYVEHEIQNKNMTDKYTAFCLYFFL